MKIITSEFQDFVARSIELICQEHRVSASLLQSRLRITHQQAMSVLEYLTRKGILQEGFNESEWGYEQKLKMSVQDLRMLDLDALFQEDSSGPMLKPLEESFVSEKKYLELEDRFNTLSEDYKKLANGLNRLSSAPGYEHVMETGMTNTYWWVLGSHYKEPFLVECFLGARFEIKEGVKIPLFDTWFKFPRPLPEMIQRMDLYNWPELSSLIWYGPVQVPDRIPLKR